MATALVACTRDDSGDQVGADDDTVDYLFVQNAESVDLSDGVLRLGSVNGQTIYFSDRPERIVGHLNTSDFVGNWGTGGDESFAADPPNAALSILNGPEPQDVVVVLHNPRLDSGNLMYDIEVLEGNDSATGEASALFIDTIGRPLTPVSVAGVHRRHRRRASRHRR